VLLVGDIGGTKTELAVFSSVKALSTPLAHATFPSARYAGFAEIVHAFLTQFNMQIDRVCLGVAGPVVAGQATITNLPWVISSAQLKDEFKLLSVIMMNDLEAMANAVPFLQRQDLHQLNVGKPALNGSLALIAPGTGLGEAFLTWNGKSYSTHMSEGGHSDFAPTNETQDALLRYLRSRLSHVSYEWVCSGMGLPNVYAYFKESGYAPEPAWLAEQLAGAQDPAPLIAKAALDNASALCVATLDTFVSILGAEAGNLALKVLATGGVYLGGGIPRRNLPFLDKEFFLQAFLQKGRLSTMLMQILVYFILHPQVALLGAAYYGFATERQEDT
jgi:glucokinase